MEGQKKPKLLLIDFDID